MKKHRNYHGKNQFYKEFYESFKKNHQCPYCGRKFNFNTRNAMEVCYRCGKYNFKTKKVEFIYRLKESLSRKGRRDFVGKV